MLAERLALAGEAAEAIALASALEENAGGKDRGRSNALNIITFYLAGSGNLTKAIEAAGQIHDKHQLGYALGTIAVAQARQGDAAAAMRTVESIAAPDARIRALVGNLWSREHPGLAVACARAGDQAGAQKCLDRARDLVAVLADDTKKEEANASMALSLAQLGDVAAGLRRIRAFATGDARNGAGSDRIDPGGSSRWDDAYRTARSVPDPEHRFVAIFQLGEAHYNAGRRDEASRPSASCWRPTLGPSLSQTTTS